MDTAIQKIARAKVYEAAIKTPLQKASLLSASLGHGIYLKREDMQPVHSFKIRGAYNKIAHLSESELKKGVIAASAGNHAQGVALAAQKLGVDAVIVMPTTTPEIKVAAVRRYGAEVLLQGDSYSDAADYCKKLTKERHMTFIHPFDDALVIAGQGSIGKEVLEQCPEVDAVFVAVGGGGLIAGIGQYIKAVKPSVKIIGVEPEDSSAMTQSLRMNKRVILPSVGIFADGVAVKQVGKDTFAIAKEVVDAMITVSTDEICSAIEDIFLENRTIVEPAGALGVAGVKKYVDQNDVKDRTLVAINSGANMSFERLRFVAERNELGRQREALYSVVLQERPGELEAFCTTVLGGRAITEFNYRRSTQKTAAVFVGIGVKGPEDKKRFETGMSAQDYAYTDLSDNDSAKEHIRHMVGGHNSNFDEQLYHFQFPERPGALIDFLKGIGSRWSISLFHYRSVGGSAGRVLIGFEASAADAKELEATFEKTEYPYTNETANTAAKIFLG